jgi:hypothetical protein
LLAAKLHICATIAPDFTQVQLEDEGEHYVLNTSTFYQFLKDDFMTDCTFMVGPKGEIEVCTTKNIHVSVKFFTGGPRALCGSRCSKSAFERII